MKEKFRVETVLEAKEVPADLKKAIDGSSLPKDLWKRLHCEIKNNRFHIFTASGFGIYTAPSVVAEGEVKKKEKGSEILWEFKWDSLFQTFICYIAILIALIGILFFLFTKTYFDLNITLVLIGFYFFGFFFLVLPPWLYSRKVLIKFFRTLNQ